MNKVLPDVPFDLQFIDCDKLDLFVIIPNSVIILGGGDVLNTYFLNKLTTKITPEIKIRDNLTVIALSVGIPYNDIFMNPLHKQKLEIFDTIFLRTRQDINVFSLHFGQRASVPCSLPTTNSEGHCRSPEEFENNNPMNTPLNILNGTPSGVPLDVSRATLPINQLKSTVIFDDRSNSNVHRCKNKKYQPWKFVLQ